MGRYICLTCELVADLGEGRVTTALRRRGIEHTYRDREFLAQFRCHEAKDESSDCDSQPEASGSHTALKVTAIPNFKHEFDDPSSESHFRTHVTQQEQCANPGHSRIRQPHQSLLQAAIFGV